MPTIWFLILWAAWVAQAVLSVLMVRKFAKRMARKRRRKYEQFRPPATVIMPFKGLEADLAETVRSLCEQEYPNYRLLLVVESQSDPAHDVLVEQLKRDPQHRGELIVAGVTGRTEGQKIHNQLAAIDRIDSDAGEDDAWVFADSDAVPGPRWLADMVGPLSERHKTGATTGYRWLVPEGRGRGALWSNYASVLNSTAASFLSARRFSYAWGGSMALRAGVARRGDLKGRLTDGLTDDYTLTRMCTDLGLRVLFVQHCLVATPVRLRLSELINFTHRQCLITRIYAPGVFWSALGVTNLFVAAFGTSVVHTVWWCWREPRGTTWWWSAAACGAVFAAHQLRASYRARALRLAFDEKILRRLRTAMLLDRWLTWSWMTMHWLSVLHASFGSTIRWRGIHYRVRGTNSVERLD